MRISDWSSDVCSSDLTTIARPAGLRSPLAGEAGGLAGVPLKDRALDVLRQFRRATEGRLPLIGVGGIASAEDAYARIRAGASLVQLYTALVFEGPGLVRRIEDGLVRLLQRRSEEHTSELQSLMRISYAVFCLTTKKIQKHPQQYNSYN